MSTYICHHGIKGQRWGVRRYQRKDGSLTPLGKRREQQSSSDTVFEGRPVSGPSYASWRLSKNAAKELHKARTAKANDSEDKKEKQKSPQESDVDLVKRIKKNRPKDDDLTTEDMRRAVNREKKVREFHDTFDDKSNPAKDTSSALAKTAKTMSDAYDKKLSEKRKHKPRMDLSDMSDEDLQRAINRELKERQYNDLFAPDNVTKGQQTISKFLNAATVALDFADTAVDIAIKVGVIDSKGKIKRR